MAEEKETTKKTAKRVVTLEDIKPSEDQKTMAILATLPLVSIIFLLTEKDNLWVRYSAGQFAIFNFLPLLSVLGVVPLLNCLVGLLLFVLAPVSFILWIFYIIKTVDLERFDIPVLSDISLKLMNSL